MKFTQTPHLGRDRTLRFLMGFMAVFLLLFTVFDLLNARFALGLSPTALSQTLFGNPGEFIEPLATSAFLEMLHGNLFFSMMAAVTLGTLFARIGPRRFKGVLLHALLGGALLAQPLLAAAFFLNDAFVWGYLIAFYLWHFAAFGVAALCLWQVRRL